MYQIKGRWFSIKKCLCIKKSRTYFIVKSCFMFNMRLFRLPLLLSSRTYESKGLTLLLAPPSMANLQLNFTFSIL